MTSGTQNGGDLPFPIPIYRLPGSLRSDIFTQLTCVPACCFPSSGWAVVLQGSAVRNGSSRVSRPDRNLCGIADDLFALRPATGKNDDIEQTMVQECRC